VDAVVAVVTPVIPHKLQLAPTADHVILHAMRIIAKRTLRQFWHTHERGADARTPLEVWHRTVERADWRVGRRDGDRIRMEQKKAASARS
jgi:hypothetical protein